MGGKKERKKRGGRKRRKKESAIADERESEREKTFEDSRQAVT